MESYIKEQIEKKVEYLSGLGDSDLIKGQLLGLNWILTLMNNELERTTKVKSLGKKED